MKRVILSSSLIILLLLIGTVAAVLYAKGYRFNADDTGNIRFVEGTGILVATSRPDGARVFVNNDLQTATNNTINLKPGDYDVRIEKDGYFTWTKKIKVEKSVVSRADALLFPTHPRLEPITLTGADSPVMDPTGSFVAYNVSSASAEKNGIYVLDMSARPILTIGGPTNQISDDVQVSTSRAQVRFAPDGSEILATVPSQVTGGLPSYYLLNSRNFTQSPRNVTARAASLIAEWDQEEALKQRKLLDSFPRDLRPIIRNNFTNISLSPEEDKILYEASRSATLPIVKKLRVLSATPETRTIQEGNIYVYDLKEDRNYLVFNRQSFGGAGLPHFVWHPFSKHILYVQDKKVQVIEFDGKNNTTIYGGPFEGDYIFPWTDGSSIVILTKLNNPGAPASLYRISLK